jgi:hypothetical protein
MFTTPQALTTRIRGRLRHLLVSPSRLRGAPPAEDTASDATATTRPTRARPADRRALAIAVAVAAVAVSLLAVAGPAAAVSLSGTTNSPVIAVVGPGNSLDYYYQSAPGTWHEQQVAVAGTTFSAPPSRRRRWPCSTPAPGSPPTARPTA